MPAFKKLLNDPVKKRRLAFWWFWSDTDHFLANADTEAFELVATELMDRLTKARTNTDLTCWNKVGEGLLLAARVRGIQSMDALPTALA